MHGKKVGLFSTRTPHRPNPIGLTVVRILEVDVSKRTITVGGLDLVHDTPVLDIKPYIKAYDSLPDSVCATWVVEGGAVHAYSSCPLTLPSLALSDLLRVCALSTLLTLSCAHQPVLPVEFSESAREQLAEVSLSKTSHFRVETLRCPPTASHCLPLRPARSSRALVGILVP